MTEQMAIEHIGNLAGDYKCWDNRISREESLFLCNLLDEREQYRALGTVEELRVAKELYDSINKIEDDICRLGMGCDDLRERIKQIYKQFRGKV